jgi:hypothetical protein
MEVAAWQICNPGPAACCLPATSCQVTSRRAGRAHGQPAPAVNAAANGGTVDAELDRLRRQYPRWRIWHGQATGDYWAMPPRDHPTAGQLIGARDIAELARRLAQAQERHDL